LRVTANTPGGFDLAAICLWRTEFFSILQADMHVLQPKRARLLTALALNAPSASYKYETELFSCGPA